MTEAEKPHEVAKKVRQRSNRGCITCRIRRVKCDEGRPSCDRCLKTGRHCDGYPAPKEPVPIAFVMLVPTSNPPECHSVSRRAFQYFHQVCAPALMNYGSQFFWNQLVLQACHHDESIKHLIIAASCAGARNENDLPRRVSTAPNDGSHVYLFHYGRALKLLSHANSPDPGLVLMACLLLILCDELQQNSFAALQHMLAGRKILSSCSPGTQHGHGHGNELINEIAPIFSQLELHTGEIHRHTMTRPPISASPRNCSTDLASSRQAMYDLTTVRFGDLDAAAEFLSLIAKDCASLRLDGSPPQTRFHVVPALTTRLNDWLNRFTAFEPINQPHWSATRRKQQLLRLYHGCLVILSRCAPFDQETAFDAYLSNIEQLMIGCSHMISYTTTRLIPILFFIATRYRSASCRRRAIELLRMCGVDGQILAKVAFKVVKIEEKKVHDPITSSNIPEPNRIRLVDLDIDASGEFYILRFRRFPYREPAPLDFATVPTQGVSWKSGKINSMHAASLSKAVLDFDFLSFWNQESPAFGLPGNIFLDF
ncbi:hypothetical protein LTR72_006366 [Exophiala xenobiotica]|nr:hypothetical protein LTR72_006366 [Exophiala xenobiotica]KAK5295144.1 hypothetical protein LTR14_004314 [Exophiala xenobiotica]KAK5482812.1 hypothetical protein LTR55_006210 [Exophiala xenobiotica]